MLKVRFKIAYIYFKHKKVGHPKKFKKIENLPLTYHEQDNPKPKKLL